MKYLSASALAIFSAIVSGVALDKRIKVFNIFSSDENKQILELPIWLRALLTVTVAGLLTVTSVSDE